ncbi:unannotated protein [freshwater metagenome]|uniref:Unannotated protein n=1 Tax=freshwater metagenome TaxID=449393 RepID=A0A6J6YBP5_9ZZZZ|nr:hypothetical protein [Actinomycetota bacterium]MSW62780.1 hypothetical protein [Actinomycetota bacterium]MSX89868.1 hypothetical protein [Actinomycetota bacterium]MSZ63476.1 hypothetical protein [Actinomycetota bacterium]MTA58414.1 hypothetical protein [Actinomycetota bacterium]
MKRSISALLALVLSFTLATLLSQTTGDSIYSESFPAVVCPPALSGLNSQISVASTKVQFQTLENRSTKTIPFRSLRYTVVKNSLVVSANGVTPVFWQSRSGSWAGGTTCSGPISSQWFVGGSSDVTTRGKLIVVNSGLSEAIVDIQAFSENGKQPLVSINLKAKSYSELSLDSFATGDKALTIHVVPRSGRINAFMIDELGAGLRALGGDYVNPVATASKTVVIPAVPNQLPKKGSKAGSPHTLRILTTSDVDSNFTLELMSSDGNFVPVGFNSQRILAGVVTELTLAPKISTGSFAVRIKSDEPIVAAISSSVTVNGRKDFVWSTSAPALVPMAIAITGLSPLMLFAADSVAVKIEVTFINGKKSLVSIKGSDVASWRVPNNVRSISILKSSPNTYAGALIASNNGYGYLPISPGSLLTRVEIPHSNIRVLNP